MSEVQSCADLLVPFFDAVFALDWEKVQSIQAQITTLEQAADKMKKQLRLELPKGLLLTISRADIFDLISIQDKIANKAQDIAGLVYGRRMQIPKTLVVPLTRFLTRCLEASQQANQAIHELDELLSTGFSGKEVKILSAMLTKLNKIESNTDDLQIKLREKLYRLESELSPIDVIFLYQVMEMIGALADRAQTLGGRLQLLLAR
jgi:predicted phosphate transport protein (TIGR00153 family)